MIRQGGFQQFHTLVGSGTIQRNRCLNLGELHSVLDGSVGKQL